MQPAYNRNETPSMGIITVGLELTGKRDVFRSLVVDKQQNELGTYYR